MMTLRLTGADGLGAGGGGEAPRRNQRPLVHLELLSGGQGGGQHGVGAALGSRPTCRAESREWRLGRGARGERE